LRSHFPSLVLRATKNLRRFPKPDQVEIEQPVGEVRTATRRLAWVRYGRSCLLSFRRPSLKPGFCVTSQSIFCADRALDYVTKVAQKVSDWVFHAELAVEA
jgi:hypothetical protein